MPQITHILIFTKHPIEQVAVKQCRIGCIMLVGEARYVETSPMVNHVRSKTIINHFFERFKLDNVSVHALHGEIRCYTLASKRPWKQRSTVAHHQKAEKGQMPVSSKSEPAFYMWKTENLWTYPEHFKISRFQRKIYRNYALVSSPLKKNTSPGQGVIDFVGRFWTLFFGFQALQRQAYFLIFFVFLLEVYHFDRILRKLAGFFPTQSAKLSIVKVSGGRITSNSLRGMPGSEPRRMRKVRTGEDLWRQSDQSTLWGLTDFLCPANSFSVEPKWNKSQIQSTCIYITVVT